MHNDESGHYKYVFVCGLQRSGTSVLGRNIARFENCTGFKNTGALMDEGQFLQDVYPIDAKFGGAGRFGFDRRAHRTESVKFVDARKHREVAGELARSLGRKQEHLR